MEGASLFVERTPVFSAVGRVLHLTRGSDAAHEMAMNDIIEHLEAVIFERRQGDPKQSYVAKLTHAGREKMAQKLGEEAVEAVIAAVCDEPEEMIGEAADIVFHLLVTLADMGISWNDVLVELARREGVSGIAEKAARTH